MDSRSDEMHGHVTGPADVPPDAVDAGATAHTTYVAAWDIPPGIAVGERFRIKVGIKCSDGCRLAHSDVAVFDHDGKQVAVGTLGDECWPGTVGLRLEPVIVPARFWCRPEL